MNDKKTRSHLNKQQDGKSMQINQKLWLFTAAVGGIRISQGYWKLATPITVLSILMYIRRK
jgi:hypothetical protein